MVLKGKTSRKGDSSYVLSFPRVQEQDSGMHSWGQGVLGLLTHPPSNLLMEQVGSSRQHLPTSKSIFLPKKGACFAKCVLQPKAGANHRSPSQFGTTCSYSEQQRESSNNALSIPKQSPGRASGWAKLIRSGYYRLLASPRHPHCPQLPGQGWLEGRQGDRSLLLLRLPEHGVLF